MTDLSTKYLGMKLHTPLVASASPLSKDVDGIRRLEDAGASAVVLYSLFEEQLRQEAMELEYHLSAGTESFAESLTYLPMRGEFRTGPEGYLEHIRRAKNAVGIPVIASLNGATLGGWTHYAEQIQEAGADAIECNIYSIPADMDVPSHVVEQSYVDILHAVKSTVHIPVAVKLSPFFSNMAYMARRLEGAGADGLVLFNRFYQPDIDVEDLAATRSLQLSDSSELRLRLHWIAMLSGRVWASLAVTGGVHTAIDIVKATMAGAHVTQMVSALLMRGPGHVRTVLNDLDRWLTEHEWESLAAMRGNMSFARVPDPDAYERSNYMLMLQSWRGVDGR